MVRDHKIRPDTRLAGSSPCLTNGVRQDQQLAVDFRALIRGFRTPALCGTAVRDAGAGVRKPPKEETAGRKGAVWLAAIYGDLRIADATRASARRPVERRPYRREERGRSCSVVRRRRFGVSAMFGAPLRTWRGQRCRAPARGWRQKRSTLRGGMGCDCHEVSMLIRLGGGERAGRGPSNVSTMIIRPPQHGHRRGDETSSASLSASALAFWGETLGAASAWRTRSMLRARTVPAKRP